MAQLEFIEQTKNLLITTEVKEVDDYLYYNAFMVNNTNGPINYTYNDERSQPLIEEPIRYRWKGALMRFSLSSYLLPKCIFIPGQWVINFVKNGVPFPAPLIFVNSTQYYQNPAQLVFDYNQLLQMVNDAFLKAYTDSGLNSPAGAPYMIYNSQTQLFSIISDTLNYAPTGSVGQVQIFFNFALNSLFGSAFPYFIVNPPPFPNCNVQINILNIGLNINPAGTIYQYNAYTGATPAAPVPIEILTFYTTTSESPINSISQINRIVIRDDSKMIIRNQAYGSNQQVGALNLLQSIIEDFIYAPHDRSIIEYTALPIRYFNMTGDLQFKQVAFSVLYMDSNLNTYPVQLIPNSISEFKFQFMKEYRSTTPKLLLQLLSFFDKDKKLIKK